METRSQARARLASPAEAERTTKIIDLNDDCLIKVFGYLDLPNLFNVAVANEWLRPAARNVYTRKFGTKVVEIIAYVVLPIGGFRSTPVCNVNEINIFDLKTSLQFLRCFGSSVDKLKIDYSRSISKRHELFQQYLNEYCAASLKHIEFRLTHTIKTEPFTKVFVNVKEVNVLYPTLRQQQLQSFVKWCPNLIRLNLQQIKYGQYPIHHPFEHLEHFIVIELREGLKCLKIQISGEREFSIGRLLDMIQDKPLLTELTYDSSNMQQDRLMSVNVAAARRIFNDHPALGKLDLPQFLFSFDGINALIGQLNSLKEFRFFMRHDDYHGLMARLQSGWTASSAGFVYMANDFITLATFSRIEQ